MVVCAHELIQRTSEHGHVTANAVRRSERVVRDWEEDVGRPAQPEADGSDPSGRNSHRGDIVARRVRGSAGEPRCRGSAGPAEEPDEHANCVERNAATTLIGDGDSPVDGKRLASRRIERQPL